MYKCIRCKRLVDADELSHSYTYQGEFWGAPAYEEVPSCPYCSGAVEPVGDDESGADDG